MTHPLFLFALAAYAAALQAFAPDLPAEHARRLAGDVIACADRTGLDARLVVAVVAVESGWNERARSPAGAAGLGQFMPETAAELQLDPDDPTASVCGTAAYLRRMLDRYGAQPPARRYRLALAAYNAGAGAVERYGGIPPFAETRRYVERVIALWRQLVSA